MYKDGKTLLDVPMDARREYLKSSVQFIQNRVMISEMRLVTGSATDRKAIMQKHLQYAVAEGLEGLVIKDIKSVYEPGSRHWIKLKKDYMQGMADSADLIVLGAWYGSGNKGGVLSTFLMGVWDKTATGFKQFKTVVKVGNGHDDTTLAKLNTYFKNSGRMSPGGPGVAPPQWIDVNTAHFPDVYINPSTKADVWEISAAEFSSTKTHTANGVSMRFPRVTKIRDDKDLNSATSLQELLALMAVSQQKGSKLSALGAHQNVNSDEEEGEGAHERGVMMRTSSKYDGPTSVVPGQHFGPLSPAAITNLKNAPQAPPSTLMDLASWHNQPTGTAKAPQPNTAVQRQASPLPLRATPYWVFSKGGFKGATPAPMPRDEEPDAPTNGTIEYVQGDVAQPRSSAAHPHQNILLVHSCAVGPGMKWSQRGTMGTLSKYIGDEPQEAYTVYTASGEAKLGDAILVECSNILNKGRLFVATILGQQGGQGGAPQVDQDAFEKALLVHLLPFAKAHQCSVHVPKFDRGAGANWGQIDKIFRYTYSRQHNLRVVVYQKAGTGEALGRQDTTLERQGTAQGLTASPSLALPSILQRAATAAPAPQGFERVATSGNYVGASIEDQFGQPTAPVVSKLLLKGVKAMLFTSEGAIGSHTEPPAAVQLRHHLVSLGAAVLPHCTFTEDERSLVLASATHIILPTSWKASVVPEAAEALLGIMADIRGSEATAVVVRGEWVAACASCNTFLPVEDYGLSKKVPPLPTPSHQVPSKLTAQVGPLSHKFITIIGGDEVEHAALAGMVQDLGGVVQDKLRMSEHAGAMAPMTVLRTGAVVSVPVAKTTHVIVKSKLKTEGAEPSSFREGSTHATNPLRTSSTTVHMATAVSVDAVNKALSLGATVLTSDWLDDCLSRYRSHAPNPLPVDSDYYVDHAILFTGKPTPALAQRSLSLVGTKRTRDEESTTPVMPPTPLTKVVHSDFEPTASAPGVQISAPPAPSQCRYTSLPTFLQPSSNLVVSVHGYGANDTAVLIQQIGQLKGIAGQRQVTVEGNLNLFCLKAALSTQQQRILVCEALTGPSLPLVKGISASCKRAIEEPVGCTEDYRAATVVSSSWVQACIDAKAIVGVEDYLYRPSVAFSAQQPAASPTAAANTGDTKAPSRGLPPTPPLRPTLPIEVEDDNAHSDSTDTASYCTFQADVSAQVTDTEAE
eukprot:GILI01009476.1.p1 GENE.GILI01009476.1~~GILI01009476.1.p1  ORF type:complete len:1293 (+),score=228.10 GILI01009476.1:302-3880(+)